MIALEEARSVIAAAEKKSKDLGRPTNIAVADGGGNFVAHVRMDEAWIGSIDISIKKYSLHAPSTSAPKRSRNIPSAMVASSAFMP